jgi:DmsE family decaheme c-type cytochrome
VHANGPNGLVNRKPAAINEQCASCHTNVWAQFQRPNHHKLPEGAMSCVDCHNPHGSIRPAMAQTFAANEPGCLNCHGDKRGPFTFEHGPVRFEGCAACHEPHGSANPRMLARPEVRLLCLECHANLPSVNTTGTIGVVPPAFHDLRSPRYQNCTVCHQKVHGSYVDRNLLR